MSTRVKQSVSHQEMQTDLEDPPRTLSSDNLLGSQDTCLGDTRGTCHSEDSVATVATRDSAASLKSANGDISKGGYGYRFDFRSSCEFEFTEDVYI